VKDTQPVNGVEEIVLRNIPPSQTHSTDIILQRGHFRPKYDKWMDL